MAATMEPPWPAALPYAWEAPESVAASGALSAEQIRRWRSTGALLLNGLLPAALDRRSPAYDSPRAVRRAATKKKANGG